MEAELSGTFKQLQSEVLVGSALNNVSGVNDAEATLHCSIEVVPLKRLVRILALSNKVVLVGLLDRFNIHTRLELQFDRKKPITVRDYNYFKVRHLVSHLWSHSEVI